MPDYANGKIYKIEPICDHEEGEIYFGSTTRRLCDRWGNHKSAFNNDEIRQCCSIVLFEKYGIENCHILLVELVTAKSKEELTAREAFYIRNNKCVNKYIPDRTQAGYYADNKDKIDERNAEYRLKNKDIVSERCAEYYENNKDIIVAYQAEYNKINKIKIAAQRADYYQKNKDIVAKRDAEYYQKNKDMINTKRRERRATNKNNKLVVS